MSNSGDGEDEIEVDDPEDLHYDIDLSGDVTPVIGGDPPDWFTGADAQILFVMYTGLVLSPSIIAENTKVTRQTVSKRLDTLRAAGFVEKLDRGKYQITRDGAFVVSGDPDIYDESTDPDPNNSEE
ncbi:helix-turn-helix domain-containing protein [Natronomonas gomsonensis]|uniref:MarR family transcriptional regulator n=1 Tax=Natronomonas gomsonensis TaxID=1046043 RepID=UPI0015B96F03|nr:helix-turn-helix domain-containing protein [Natronomonas gomsonensis]